MNGRARTGPEPLAGTPAPTPTSGFQAQLEGASLWDLVQMECLARSHVAFQVTGEGGVGHLYFDAGRVVHATTARNRGVAAALEILGWTQGTFQPSNRSWPTGGPSIDVTPEALLLSAAKNQDENGASNLVAFPAAGRGAEPAVEEGLELMEIEDDQEFDDEDVTRPGGQVQGFRQGPADFPVMVRLAASGNVIRNKGGTEDLAEATAYAHRLAQLTGELLGLEQFVALECISRDGRYLMFSEGEGEIVLLRPRPDLDLQAMRGRLGL
jgi:hypothetical protein